MTAFESLAIMDSSSSGIRQGEREHRCCAFLKQQVTDNRQGPSRVHDVIDER